MGSIIPISHYSISIIHQDTLDVRSTCMGSIPYVSWCRIDVWQYDVEKSFPYTHIYNRKMIFAQLIYIHNSYNLTQNVLVKPTCIGPPIYLELRNKYIPSSITGNLNRIWRGDVHVKISASSFDQDNLVVKIEKVRRRNKKNLLCSGDTGPP
jgi:hypothetical protein